VSAKGITDELVQQVADELEPATDSTTGTCVRSARDLPTPRARAAPNIEFAKRFTEEHRETFDRLAK
jgi:hypothetical protein